MAYWVPKAMMPIFLACVLWLTAAGVVVGSLMIFAKYIITVATPMPAEMQDQSVVMNFFVKDSAAYLVRRSGTCEFVGGSGVDL